MQLFSNNDNLKSVSVMTKKSLYGIAMAACMCAVSCGTHENTITWQTLGNGADESGRPTYVQRFTIDADGPFERMAFCMFKRGMYPVDPADTLIELLPGYFAVGSPRFAEAKAGEPVVVELVTSGALRNISYAPDGMHLVCGGKPVRVKNVHMSTTAFPEQWQSEGRPDGMIYGDRAWAINDSLRSAWRPEAYKQIPTPKRVVYGTGRVAVPAADKVTVRAVDDPREEYYTAVVGADGSLTVSTNSDRPEALAARVLARIAESADADGLVPAGEIEDWADLGYRGLMIDVARNFTGKEDMKIIIDLMARYGLNVLHFHLGDDEGWRVEIPELPELTSVGARRGYTESDDVPFLKGIYSGDGNPEAGDTPANGYYTRADYIELLRYADSLGVAVLPEFDSPGHSRAAIRAMEHRYRTTGDDALRLIHDGDSSRYTSAQAYHDNVLNPALEGPYRFWDIVMGSIADTYKEAGVELPGIHIGGDEVPAHAWDGSDAVRRLMEQRGFTEQRQVHAMFVEKVAGIAAARGIKIAGWQEIALGHTPEYNAAVRPQVMAVNCWTNTGDYGQRIAAQGFPLILSNVDYLYFDQTPTTHPEEPGLTWGGIVDEFRPLHATVDALCPADSAVQANVAGISAQIFAETVRSRAMIERYLLPRILGLAERAHNKRPTLSDSEYFGALTGQIALWAEEGRDFNLRQPGIRVNDGKVEMNDAYGFGEIRYTLDGSQPSRDSALYTGPFDVADAGQIRARLFAGEAESVTSILYVNR